MSDPLPDPDAESGDAPRLRQLMQDVLAGDRTLDDVAVQDAIRRDEGFARELAQLTHVGAVLADYGADRAAASRGAVSADDRLLVGAALDRIARRARWRHGPLLLALAAAAVVVSVITWAVLRAPAPPAPQQLGPETGMVLAPADDQRLVPGTLVTWTGKLGRLDERYQIEVVEPSTGRVVWRTDLLARPPWLVPDTSSWPEVFQLRLSVVTMDEMPTGQSATRTYRR